MATKLWQGRFSEKTAKIVEAFTASIDVDRRLYAYDIQGSIAHCKMLAGTGIISDDEAVQIVDGLRQVQHEIESGQFSFSDSLEDIHTHIETRLVEIVGQVAGKLHTARSRNDQVALDVRLYLRDEVRRLRDRLIDFQGVMVDLAEKHLDVVLPGYTHLQRAQPVLLAHHLMAYYEMFSRDADRLEDVLERVDVMPLGSAALAGTTYPIDRAYTAELLNFPRLAANSIDAVSDRDFVIEFVSAASICMMHLSRLSEELILWSSAEFNFIELPEAFATGSSIMPQKKNPDVAELVRGKTGRVFGSLTALLTMMKSLPLAYDRDMQEDKALLFDTVDTLGACIEVYLQMLPQIAFHAKIMEQAASRGFLNATDLADYLVMRGMPFREAHHCVGQAVQTAVRECKELHELTLNELRKFSPLIQSDVYEYLSLNQMIDRRQSAGGTSTDQVKAAVRQAQIRLGRKVT
jgi:argininosuccinate lyase